MSSPILYHMTVRYYETDQMGIVHHSNYIRWMEEARIHAMREGGVSLRDMEAEGIQVPVTAVSCEYRKPAHFDDGICIEILPERYNGVRMELGYRILREDDGELLSVGHSRHCFLDARTGYPVGMKRRLPAFHRILGRLFSNNEEDKDG